MAFLEVSGVVKSYQTATRQLEVLRGVDIQVDAGEMVAIVGASGVGKSTLLHVLGGLDTFDAGTVVIGGAAIHEMDDEARVRFRNQHVGFVFQFHHLLPEFTALENVEMPLWIAGTAAAERHARAAAVLDARRPRRRASIIGPARCPAASSSAWRSRARSSRVRRCSWPTSRPAISTSTPRRTCSNCCARCTASTR